MNDILTMLEAKLSIKDKGRYFIIKCPGCNEQSAYLYKNQLEKCKHNARITCNRKNHCSYNSSIAMILDMPGNENSQEMDIFFVQHNLDKTELIRKELLDNKGLVVLPGNKRKKLGDDGKGKIRWLVPRGYQKKENGAFFPPLVNTGDTLWFMEGDWDFLKASDDGICCTATVFGAGTMPNELDFPKFQRFSSFKICYNTDTAGIEATQKLAKILKNKFPHARVEEISLLFTGDEKGKDYCDYRQSHSVEEFLALPAMEAKNFIEELEPEQSKGKNSIFESDGKTFIWKESHQKGEAGEKDIFPLEIANFILRVPKKIVDDNGDVSWMLQLQKQGEKKELEIAGSDLAVLSKFREKIAGKGGFLSHITDTPTHNVFVEHAWKESCIQEVRKTQYLGKISSKAFLFSNKVVTPYGVEDLKEIVPPKGSKLKLTDRSFEMTKLVRLLEEIIPRQSWKMFGFAVGTLFVQEITDRYGHFPLLFPLGRRGSGKNTTIADTITGFFGGKTELKEFTFNSTIKSIQRRAAQCKGIPLTINEYQSKETNNLLLCSLHDREGYQRAKTDNSLEVISGEINATFMVLSTHNISGYKAEDVLSRVIEINMNEAKVNFEAYNALIENQENFSSFIPHCMGKITPEMVLTEIEKTLRENRRLCRQKVEQRIIENYSIIQACNNLFLDSLGIKEFRVSWQDIESAIVKANEATESADIGYTFLGLVEAMVRKGELPMNMAKIENVGEKEILYFSLRNCLPFVKRLCESAKYQTADEKTIANALKVCGAENRVSRELGKLLNVWSWVITKQEM